MSVSIEAVSQRNPAESHPRPSAKAPRPRARAVGRRNRTRPVPHSAAAPAPAEAWWAQPKKVPAATAAATLQMRARRTSQGHVGAHRLECGRPHARDLEQLLDRCERTNLSPILED